MPRTPAIDRLMRMVAKQENGCWLWMGYIDPQGYGSFRSDPRRHANKAHREAYILLRGPIPDGLHLDHLCRVRHCVNPEHLEPVTPRMNTDRSSVARREFCEKAGHPMTPDNTGSRKDGRRYCKQCHRERMMRLRAATHE